jgi:hypothetical protein
MGDTTGQPILYRVLQARHYFGHKTLKTMLKTDVLEGVCVYVCVYIYIYIYIYMGPGGA